MFWNIGCKVGDHFAGILVYADDIDNEYLSFSERLKPLKIETLEQRRIKSDLELNRMFLKCIEN